MKTSGRPDTSYFPEAWTNALAELRGRAGELNLAYRAAKPVPHIVIDDFLPLEIAEGLLSEFPDRDASLWAKLPTDDQRGKLATTNEEDLPPVARIVVHELNSGSFLGFLEQLTGISDLIADTKLVGGGLHRIERGGKLSVHVDFSHHPSNGLYRRLNLLIYLNKNWREEYGGHFELWTPALDKPAQRILPIFNRCAIFSTSSRSFHGHPEPLTCPQGDARKSLALYYFTKEGPPGEESVHNTTFKSRPGERTSVGNRLMRAASSGVVRDLLPPIVYRGIRKIWNRGIAGG